MRLATRVLLALPLFWLAACKTTPPLPPEPPPQAEAKKPFSLYEWNGQGKSISSIKINVDEQKAYLYNGEDQIGWTYVATGITSYPTPTGDFKILEKVQNKVSNLYGKSYSASGGLANSDFKVGRDLVPSGGKFVPAKMPYFMRLSTDGVGMHIGPIPKPGRRASHGCIRLPSKMAPLIFANAAVGTPVSIVGSGPDYQTYLAQSRKKAAANAAKYAAAKRKAADQGTPAGPPAPAPSPEAATNPPNPPMPSIPAGEGMPAPGSEETGAVSGETVRIGERPEPAPQLEGN